MPELGRLGTRLVLGSVAGAVLAVAIVAAIDAVALRAEFDRFSREQQADRAAQIVASLADAYARRGGWAAADLRAAQQLAAAAGASLRVEDASGSFVLSTTPADVPMPMPMAMMRAMHGDPALGLGPERREPVVVDGRVVGAAAIRFPSGDLLPAEREVRDALARAQWLAALVAALAAIPVGVVVARRITRPIESLATATAALARGERGARAAETTDDEIGALARSFNTMAEALAREDELRRQLLGDVAHELRTPLTTLQGHLEALRDGVLAPDPPTLAALHDEAARLGRLVADLESLARAEAAALSLERARLDFAGVARDVAGELADAFRAKGVALELDLAAVPVDGDADRLAQVARNLLANALKFTPAGGRVRVATGRDGPGAFLEVADTGPGIAPEDLPHVFERFWRGRDAAGVPGSGIGLTVARELARAHGGGIAVASERGRGTAFRVTLPPR